MPVKFIASKHNASLPVRQVVIGQQGINAITIGQENAMPFMTTDGTKPTKTRIAVEIHDTLPEKYPELLIKGWQEVTAQDTPICRAIAAKELGADLIALRVESIREPDKNPADIIELAKQIINNTLLPLCILGINNRELDRKYLPQIAEGLKGYNCLFGPVEEETYKDIIPALRDNNHCVIARTPIDINLAKQLNILISEMGFNPDKIIIDPNMGGLGYGLDYGYSVIEKIRLAAFEGDSMLNMPIIAFTGEETWRTKEAKADINDDTWGNAHSRATIWELLTTSSMIMTGADIVTMKYPESIKYIARFLKEANQ